MVHSKINPEFCSVFVNKPTVTFKRNKNIQDLIGGHLIKDGKIAKKKLEKRQGKSKTCTTIRSALCCMQVVNTNTFSSNQTIIVFFSTYTIPLHAKFNGLSTYYNVSHVIFNM